MELFEIVFNEENQPVSRKQWTGLTAEDSETGAVCYAEIKKVVINRDTDSAIHFEVFSSKEAKAQGKKKLADKTVQIPLSQLQGLTDIVTQEAYKLALKVQSAITEYYNEIPLTESEISAIIELIPAEPENII